MVRERKIVNFQGNRANTSGKVLESAVENVCLQKGFKILSYSEYSKSYQDCMDCELLIRNVPFISIYGHNARTEFLLKSSKYALETRIECKWQQTSGSVDEKLPYLYLNCIEAMPERHIIVIIDGGGLKKGAVEWLRSAAESLKYTSPHSLRKRLDIFSLSEFLAWANSTLR